MKSTVIFVGSNSAHTMGKQELSVIRLIEGFGVENDAHAGKTVQHRSRLARGGSLPNLRQVHLIHAELHTELAEKGFSISPGQMGENITTQGIDLLGLPTGTRLKIGSHAVIEITGLRNPCAQLDGIQPGLMAATLERKANGRLLRKSGVMSVVIVGGDIKSGDEIEIQLPAPPHIPLKPV